MGESHAEPGKIRMWLGHNAIAIYAVALIISAASEIMKNVTLLKFASAVSLGFGVIATVLLLAYHDRKLCHACMKEIPFLNPQAEVDKHIRKLRFAHRYVLQRVILLSAVGLSLAEPIAMGFGFKNVIVSLLTLASIFAAMVIVGYVTRLHNRLQPWCPFCRNHGHGDHDHPEPPDPTLNEDLKEKTTR